ncbi:MAG: aminomethyl-transferring glycine dehydrogenase, partial [Zoogloeaceae bacterium]|nr:aminomethyl-transferring glycine dehydrogenase [Zoogloeaceae bacterium]
MITLSSLTQSDEFLARHLGPNPAEQAEMLRAIGADSLKTLIAQTVPAAIRLPAELDLPEPRREHQALADLRALACKNILTKNLIGLGYHDTLTPTVILRNVLENPGWYTAYTPYQAEISQGRLEALLTFQQMTIDLTGLELANASLLDEATAAAEAMTMARRVSASKSSRFFVDRAVLPQTLDVLKTRAAGFGFELVLGEADALPEGEFFGALLQYPSETGAVADLSLPIAKLKAAGAVVAVAADLMALVLLKSPGEMGADIALGSSQRFGIPMGFGGPHAAFFATRATHARAMPGRLIGISRDAAGNPALRMALQTREQHIRREKANSNLCTAQVLLANMAGLYAVYHGPTGLKTIAQRIHRLAAILGEGLYEAGIVPLHRQYFDTVRLALGRRTETVYRAAQLAGYNLRWEPEAGQIGIAVNEKTTPEDVARLFRLVTGNTLDIPALDARLAAADPTLPAALLRTDALLTHPVFNAYHTEHALLRYLKKLQNRDLAMDHAMISLGSCTMKLNATSEMMPITWPEFTDLHPFAPEDQTLGIREMIGQLAGWLKTITGMDAICMQPNSGAQGEYAGLLAIRRYHASRGEGGRNLCLIPKSAHGTNPASAHMAGLDVVEIACDAAGNIDLADLETKAKLHRERLACLMLTYPSTHGVFEEAAREICALIHAQGGQVYLDGANLNAQVGLTSPGVIGADVSHMNLHKTFAIPHGGGGPGMGPIALKTHLAPFMPGHVWTSEANAGAGMGAVSAAPFGSASILPIAWMYIALLGGKGVKAATQTAILNANYIASRLNEHYPVLHTGKNGRVAHECILDVRPLKAATGITETDIAKRLMDYGFHAPTVSFPVPGALMVEPTESENKAELDRFIAALTAIRAEIRRVEQGDWPADDNPLKHAPHTAAALTA